MNPKSDTVSCSNGTSPNVRVRSGKPGFLAVNNAAVHNYGFTKDEFLSDDCERTSDRRRIYRRFLRSVATETYGRLAYVGVWRDPEKRRDILSTRRSPRTICLLQINALVCPGT